MSTLSVVTEVMDERARQDAKWGPIQSIPDFTPLESWGADLRLNYTAMLEAAREENEGPHASFESVLREEVCEAMLETRNRADLRAELIQVAAVAVKWVEHIDRTEGRS